MWLSLLVFALIVFSWVPYALRSYTTGLVVQAIIFHLLLLLVIVSYIHAMVVEPGVVSSEWSEYISRLPLESRQQYEFCPKSQQYKPKRAHYCRATDRLVLNMDHFCPWIANTVGFYNRKFFVQFLVYAALAANFAFFSTLTQIIHCINTGDPHRGCSTVVYLAFMIDGVEAVMLSLFAGFHLYMVLTNRTSVEITQELSQDATLSLKRCEISMWATSRIGCRCLAPTLATGGCLYGAAGLMAMV